MLFERFNIGLLFCAADSIYFEIRILGDFVCMYWQMLLKIVFLSDSLYTNRAVKVADFSY